MEINGGGLAGAQQSGPGGVDLNDQAAVTALLRQIADENSPHIRPPEERGQTSCPTCGAPAPGPQGLVQPNHFRT